MQTRSDNSDAPMFVYMSICIYYSAAVDSFSFYISIGWDGMYWVDFLPAGG